MMKKPFLPASEEGLHLLPPWILTIWYPPVIARTLFRSGGSTCDIILENFRSRFRMSAMWMPAPLSSSPSVNSPCRTPWPARSVVNVVSSLPPPPQPYRHQHPCPQSFKVKHSCVWPLHSHMWQWSLLTTVQWMNKWGNKHVFSALCLISYFFFCFFL